MRALERLGPNIRLGDREELPLVRDRVTPPAREQRVDELICPLAAGAWIDVVLRVLLVGPADGEPEYGASASEDVEGRDPLRQIDRAVVARDEDARADRDGRRPRGDGGQQLHRLQDRSIRLGDGKPRSG